MVSCHESAVESTYKASIGNAEKSYELPKEIEHNIELRGARLSRVLLKRFVRLLLHREVFYPFLK
jgi:hypothetical protein